MDKFIKAFLLLITITSLSAPLTSAQEGGNNTYDFLNLTNSARIAAMGGDFLTIKDRDITLAVANPSIISPSMNNNLALSFVDYFSDINYGFASYSKSFDKIGSFVGTMQFINYGEFKYADINGVINGTFTANELALVIGWGRQLDSLFSIGANLKMIYSGLESYTSYGVAVDVAGTYANPESGFAASLIFKNIGRQIKSYTGNNSESLPFEIQAGLSKRLSHIPFRYSVLLTHLEKWDLTYIDPLIVQNNTDPLTGELIEQTGIEDFADKFFRHIVIGGELILTENFNIRIGYNYRRRQEMKVDTKLSTVGFSWGFGIRVSKFNFSYSRSAYHLTGSPNYITITTDLSKLF